MLVVSETFPAHDTNAGDWRVYTLCRELAKEHTVYFLALAFLWDGRRYIDDLQRIGVRVLLPGTGGTYDFPRLLKSRSIRTVIFEWYDTAEHFIRYFPLCEKVVIDTHELYYVKERRRFAAEGLRGGGAYLVGLRRKELDVYRFADALITVSEQEKRVLQKEFRGKKILVMPTWGEPPRKKALPGFSARKDLVFFASFRNREQADGASWFIRHVLPRVRAALPGVKLHLAGERSFVLADTVAADRAPVRIDGPVPDIYGYLSRFRVFVCPLRYGAGQKKKILDAAFAGCPVVATKSGREGVALRPGRDILLAESPEDFARKIISLYSDENAWHRTSGNALRRIRECNPYGGGFAELNRYMTGAGGK